MTKKEPGDFVDLLLNGPTVDDDIVDEINRRPHFVSGIDPVQIAVPVGRERECRDFYVGALGLTEIPRPDATSGRSILWVAVGDQQIHFRPDSDFSPARFAHPGLLVGNAEALATTLRAAGFEVTGGDAVGPGRFHTHDPFGNRLEFIESGR